MFVATNQAFFMGMFFFISAYFILLSLNKKGTSIFIKERLIRLGVPLIVFYFLLYPLIIFIRDTYIFESGNTFIDFIKNPHAWGFGPMWFVEALLIFTGFFLLIRLLKFKIEMKFLGSRRILLFAFLIGLGQFIIRIWLPVGWGSPITGFQFPHFLQYISLFSFGIIAYQNKRMENINSKMGKQWFIFAQILIVVGFPLLFVLGGAHVNGTDKFMGGFTWQCFSYPIWEQLVGFSLIIGLIGIFKQYFNKQRKFAKKLSDSAYGVYLLHTPILIGISALFISWQIPQILKFVALAPIAIFTCFLVAWLVKKIPGVNKIL